MARWSISRLSGGEATFNVVAPFYGGYGSQVRSFANNTRDELYILVERGHGAPDFWLKVIPVRRESHADPTRSTVYLFNKAHAIVVDYKDDDYVENPKFPPMEVWLSLNSEVTAHGMPAGTLKIFNYPVSIDQIGA